MHKVTYTTIIYKLIFAFSTLKYKEHALKLYYKGFINNKTIDPLK